MGRALARPYFGALLAVALAAAAPAPPPIRFEEIGAAAGARLEHHLRQFAGPHADILETFTAGGSAVAAADYDGDGDDDLFVTDSDAGRPNRLLRNEWVPTGALRFTEVAAAAGVDGGNDRLSIVADALWFDADGDGRSDLLVARFGTPLLYRNLGGGKFRDVTAGSGLETEFANTIAAIAFDADGDGRLDLLLGHYFQPVNLIELPTPHVLPNDLDAAVNGGGVSLWRNVTAPGSDVPRFVEVSEKAGLAGSSGWSLDVGHADLDNDGDQDLYVAGDYGTDRLYWNRGDGTFEDGTQEAIGLDTKKGMNVDVGDYDRDGWLDVYVTNITDDYMRECNMLWHNQGRGADGRVRFTDVAKETGTCNTLWGWAAKFADFDNDGWEDLFAADGLRSAGPEEYVPLVLELILRPGVDFTDVRVWPAIGGRSWSGYQKKKLFRNLGGGTFKEVAAEAGVDNDGDGRGVAVADLDQDGLLDFYQTNAGQPALLYRNRSPRPGRWLGLKLVGAGANRDAIGARVTVRAGSSTWIREVNGGNGYAGQSTTRVHVGLGAVEKVDSVEVRWPGGRTERFAVPLDRYTTVREGEGSEDLLWHHRNLGKAFYENPTTHDEAVVELRKALDLAPDSPRERLNLGLALLRAGRVEEGIAELERVQKQDPSIPHTWFNLGVAWKQESQYEKALAQFQRMVELVPDEPISHYNLGYLYRLSGAGDKALPHFERAATLDANFAAPRFQLWNAYRQAGREEDAARVKAEFDRLKELQKNAAVPEDVDWSWYAELWDPPEAREPVAAPAPLSWEASELPGRWAPAEAGLALLAADADSRVDLLAWDGTAVKLLAGGREPRESGLEGARGVLAVAPGDFDNDGRVDLCFLAGGEAPGVSLWRNAGGRFTRVEAPLPAGPYRKAVWLDFDHDYDLDLLLLGRESRLMRNQGADHLVRPTPPLRGEPLPGPGGQGVGAWGDETARFPFVAGEVLDAVAFDLVADSQGVDLAVSFAGRPGILFRDRLGGRYEAQELPALPAGARGLVAADIDRDGWTDLASTVGVLLNTRSSAGELRMASASASTTPPLALADLGNRAANDLVAAAGVLPDLGAARFGAPQPPPGFPAAAAVAADFDGDGRVDLAALGEDGVLRLIANRTAGANRWLAVALAGVKNLKLAPGAEIEVKAGASYQKKLYAGVPLHFGLGTQDRVDTVRITWPNGLIQNEPRQPTGQLLAYEEAPRLSGSCPMIFTWNGERFQFITDVLGVAPLGASAGDGQYFPVDHDEVIQISGAALAAVDGRYEVRITEELREVAFIDQVRLLAVDHPAEVEVFTNDKFKGPPFPEFRLFGVTRPVRPLAARDHLGNDVLPRLRARDHVYPDAFRRDHAGIAELHHLELDFGRAAPDGRALLVLSGWVDWADGSTFLGAAQAAPGGLVMPYLQVRDEHGAWRTVLEDMGIPAGKPKTIVVDLSGKWLSAARGVRIVTSLCVYWDEIFLAEETGDPPLALAEAPTATAELRFRGFSRPVIHPERKQPESFDYQTWMPVSMWNPTPGLYTRYGDVRELLGAVDDRLVVMGSGDELRLSFDARALPPLPPGWRRDFLLWVDGWAKDGDANTAYSQTVEPLPFHGMSQYPYPPSERFPDDPEHREYRRRYNTRPALRLLRPLPSPAAAAPRP